jgi:hypothetical protein
MSRPLWVLHAVVALLIIINPWPLVGALTCQSVAEGGLWHDPETWTQCGDGTGIPGPEDTAVIGVLGINYAPVTIAKSAPAVDVAVVSIQQGALYINGNNQHFF